MTPLRPLPGLVLAALLASVAASCGGDPPPSSPPPAPAGPMGSVASAFLVTHVVYATLANASVYLEAFGHIAIAWIWLEQGLAAETKEGDFYEGKRSAMRYFFRWELPNVDAQLDLLGSLDRSALDMQDAFF